MEFPWKGLCIFDYKGQGMRTDVLLPKSGEIVTVVRRGEPNADKGYNEKWCMCELNGKEGWLPLRYLIALPKNTCPECRNLFGTENRVRTCSECAREVCSLCGENFVLKVKRGQTRSAFICAPCAKPMVAGRSGKIDEQLNGFFEN